MGKSVGNTDDSKRGRGLGPGGRDSKDGKLSGKQADPKKVGSKDYDGHKIGKRGK